MTPSTVYRKAAERIASGKCFLLWTALDNEYLMCKIEDLFCDPKEDFYYGNNQLARSLALLFMAEIAEEEK